MKTYQITIKITVQGDDEEHALEQAFADIEQGQFTPHIEEV